MEDKLKPGIYFTADNGSHIYLNGEQLEFDLGESFKENRARHLGLEAGFLWSA